MAITAATVWEMRSGGAATNGGGFDPSFGGVDYTLQDSAQATGTASSSGTTLTATTGIFTSQMVGNMVTNGTNWAQITAFTSSTVVTIDSSPAWTTQSISVGGAIARLDTIAGTTPVVVPGNIIWVNTGTFTNTTAQTIGADGSMTGGQIHIIGYSGTRQDTVAGLAEASMPILTSATTGINVVSLNGATRLRIKNIKTTHTFATATSRGYGFTLSSGTNNGIVFENCVSDGCLAGWFANGVSNVIFIGCTVRDAKSTTVGGMQLTAQTGRYVLENCAVYGGAGPGIIYSATTNTDVSLTMINCTVANNASNGLVIASTTGSHVGAFVIILNCVFHANTGAGIQSKITTGNVNLLIKNCIFSANTVYELRGDTANFQDNWHQINNAFYTTGTGVRSNVAGYILGDITLTASPFTNAASKDFSLNNTASAGASCRAAGIPAQIGVNTVTDETFTYRDIGPAQIQSSGGGTTRVAGIKTGGAL